MNKIFRSFKPIMNCDKMTNVVKVGILGCGFMGQIHLMNFLKCRNCKVVAVCDKKKKLVKMIAEKWKIPKYYYSHIDMAEDKEIDAVAIITNDHLHAPLSTVFMKSGKHVFVEKPIATTSEDAKEMVRVSEKYGVILMVAYMKRYDTGIEKAKEVLQEILQSGRLGDIISVRVHDYGGDWICNFSEPILKTDEPYPQFTKRFPKWLPEDERERYYAFNNIFCHDINLMRYFLGNPKEILFTNFTKGVSNITVFDYETYNVVLETGFYKHKKAIWDETVEIYFDKGWLKVEVSPPLLINVPARVIVYEADSGIREIQVEKDWAFRREVEHFINCILNDVEPKSSGKDSLIDIEIVENIFKKFLKIKGEKFEDLS